MRSVMRAVLAGALLVAGCCAPNKAAVDALSATWDDGTPESIRPYAAAGIECDPALREDLDLPEADREARRQARARRLRVLEEFTALLKELQAHAR